MSQTISPSTSPENESSLSKRQRNNLAVRKCREAKRQQEKEMLDAVKKQQEINQRLQKEFEKIQIEERMLRAMLPICGRKNNLSKCTNSESNS